MDAPTLLVLETQLRQLGSVLDALASERAQLVPAKATFWAGHARQAYDRAVLDLDERLGSTLDVLTLARQSTLLAMTEALPYGR